MENEQTDSTTDQELTTEPQVERTVVPLACARSFEAVRAAGGDCESCRRSAVLHESVFDRSAVLA